MIFIGIIVFVVSIVVIAIVYFLFLVLNQKKFGIIHPDENIINMLNVFAQGKIHPKKIEVFSNECIYLFTLLYESNIVTFRMCDDIEPDWALLILGALSEDHGIYNNEIRFDYDTFVEFSEKIVNSASEEEKFIRLKFHYTDRS